MNILAIDPGTKCGWALWDGVLSSGVWNLAKKDKTKWGVLWRKLGGLKRFNLDLLVYEKVMAHPNMSMRKTGRKGPNMNVLASHCYGGIEATLQMWAEDAGVDIDSRHVGTIKKHATERGNASKESMLAAAQAKWPDQNVTTHDQADALWLLDLVRRELG